MLQLRAALSGGRAHDVSRRRSVQNASEHAADGKPCESATTPCDRPFSRALDDAQRRVLETQHQVSTGLANQLAVGRPRRRGARRASRRVAGAARSVSGERDVRAQSARARGRIAERSDRPSATHSRAHAASQQRQHECRRSARHRCRDSAVSRRTAGARQHDRRRRPLICSAAIARRRRRSRSRPAAASSTTATKGQRTLQISDSRFVAINDSGADVFQRIPRATARSCSARAAPTRASGMLGASSVVNAGGWVRRHLHDQLS